MAETYAYSTPGETTTHQQFEAFVFAFGHKIRHRIEDFGIQQGGSGFSYDEIEDIYQQILIRWFEVDGICSFDYDKGILRSTPLFGFVNKFLLNYMTQKRRAEHRAIPLESVDWNVTSYRSQTFQRSTILHDIDHYLATLPTKGKQNLQHLFNEILEQVETTGKFRQNVVARHLGISERGVGFQMDRLRQQLLDQGFVRQDLHSGSISWVA